ncbi:MAG: hypothetical protein R2856_34850 [Caldilineaceae bacterium]
MWGDQFSRIGDIKTGAKVVTTMLMTQTIDTMPGATLAWRLYQPDYSNGQPDNAIELKRTVLENLLQGSIGFDGLTQVATRTGKSSW